jgi:hypothetical protein
MVIHYGQTADGWEQYTDDIDCLSCEIVTYAKFELDTVEFVLHMAQLNLEHSDTPIKSTGYTVQVGDTFEESEDATLERTP